jgi:hypothetical protein
MTEQWVPLPASPDTYEISNLGNVRRKDDEKLKKISPDCAGYMRFGADKRPHRLHRELARAFIPNPDNLLCVDHINRDKSDNILCNLRWASVSDNGVNCGPSKNNQLTGHKFLTIQRKRYVIRINNKRLQFCKLYHMNDYTLEQVVAERNRVCDEAGVPY